MTSKNIDKRLEKGEETYNRILLSAIEIIAESGIRGITASKLSTLSNVSKSNIFHHFKTIKEIPEEALNLILKEFMRQIDEPTAKDLYEFLMDLGAAIIDITEEYKKTCKSFFSFYYESMFNEVYQKIIRDFLNTSKANLTLQIIRYSTRPLEDQEVNTLSTLILSTLDGIGLHILMDGDEKEYMNAWELQVKLICNML